MTISVIEENVEALASHVRGGVHRGYIYSVNRADPSLHLFSPDMTLAERNAAKAAASGTEQQWVDAHPAAVKTFLLAQPANIRAAMQLGAQNA